MRSRPILSALLAAATLTACESQEAADHRAAVRAIETASASLREVPAAGEQAITQLKSIAQSLRGLRGVSRGLKASQLRLLTQIDLQLAAHIRQAGLESRSTAIEAAATIESLAASAAVQERRLGQWASTPGQLGGDELSSARLTTMQQRQDLLRQHENRQPDLATLETANTEAAAEVLTLRTRAAELIAEATSVDAIAGRPLRAEAASLIHHASGIEADMERRAATADLHVRLDLENLSLRTDGVSRKMDAIDEELGRIQTLANNRTAHDAADEAALLALGERLSEASNRLIDLVTGPLAENYAEALATLQNAAKSASNVKSDRASKEGDQLARIQTQVAMMNLAAARADMLARSTRLLGMVAALGQAPGTGKWSETRQVLQQGWEDAAAIATQARAECITIAGTLGGEAAANLLSQLGGSESPPDAPQETPEPPLQP